MASFIKHWIPWGSGMRCIWIMTSINRLVVLSILKKCIRFLTGREVVKVWAVILNQNTNVVDEIVINYRHDSKEQVEDSRRLKDFTDFHVGLYSTDFVFQWKSTGIKKP